jgi:nucleoside-diphosphate-sugar epimerase
MRMIIFGCGYSGQAIAQAATAAGASVVGTARSGDRVQTLEAQGIHARIFDGTGLSNALLADLKYATHLVQSIPPGSTGDPLLALLKGRIRDICPKLEWIGYLSTVGVYGDSDGGWVDEETPCQPKPGRSQERVDAEDAWVAEGARNGVPVAVLRLAGIYGPGRNAFVNLNRGTARRIIKKNQVFNRIRVEDIGLASTFMAERCTGGIFNITDDEPAPPQDVIEEAARLMGVEPPPEQDFETADMTPMARSFYSANKRVSNKKISALGFRFQFPNYRTSLAQMWADGTWPG